MLGNGLQQFLLNGVDDVVENFLNGCESAVDWPRARDVTAVAAVLAACSGRKRKMKLNDKARLIDWAGMSHLHRRAPSPHPLRVVCY